MKTNKAPFLLFACLLFSVGFCSAQSIFTQEKITGLINLANTVIYVDKDEDALVKKAAAMLQQDIASVTGKTISIINDIATNSSDLIIIGSVDKSALLKKLITQKSIKLDSIKDKWEDYQIQTVKNIFGSKKNALLIAGSDRRGTAYGVFELSKQMGVSPWYWWADVPVKKQTSLYVNSAVLITDAPKVKYRGIFINDEAPALSNWSKEKFGGFNHQFYEKVFELMLRLKSNYLWPAMWGSAFYYDDSLNIKSADEYGIVIGTSHHEPLMRAHEEWKYFGKGQKWNYDSTEAGLKEFWRAGMQRATNEKIVTVGMRGDGDEPMSRQTATTLLERIVKDQREIIKEVTGKPANETPQLWALYKEVQDYYDQGMRVPDDITLLLCDDNWGNIRRLPQLTEKPRKGGYGIYYHFDYVGGPRNYKWLNTNPLPRVWEQMHLAWEYNAKDIWIVNVGDIKPMELPISFFLDYAWNPTKIDAADIQTYTETWATAQFGKKYAKQTAKILAAYAKYNGRKKPELLNENSYSLANYNEADRVTKDYKDLLAEAENIYTNISPEYKDAFYQLVLHPVKACANLQELYTTVAKNKADYAKKYATANEYADKAKQLFINDSLITKTYHQLNNGKWNHMMSQTHIGYTYWQQPSVQKMPEVKYVPADSILAESKSMDNIAITTPVRAKNNGADFYEKEKLVSMEAGNFTRAISSKNISWKILPDLGRTGSAITSWPVTAASQKPDGNSPHVEYEFNSNSSDTFKINAYFSPTLNFQHTKEGLQYAISVDEEVPQIISINIDDNKNNVWNGWMSNNIILKRSQHKILKNGKHVLKYWMVNSGVVLQKLVIDFGGVKQSYLGPPETRVN